MKILNDALPFQLHPEYMEILDKFGVCYTCDEYYIKVDLVKGVPDRVIFVSGILSQMHQLIETVVPYLVEQEISFSMVKSLMVAKMVQNANFGEEHIGKLILIYLPESVNQDLIIQDLVRLTKSFKGPAVPLHQFLGGLVYAKGHHSQPLSGTKKRMLTLKNTYLLTDTLKIDPKGNVYEAIYLNKYLMPCKCVIKQGRYCMWSDEDGRDIWDRLHWQQQIHNRLSATFNIPKYIDYFQDRGDVFLVMQFINGKPLNLVLEDIYRGKSWSTLSKTDKIVVLELVIGFFEMVGRLHAAGYVHRDLTPGNFILKTNGQLFMIDLELVYDIGSGFPSPVFTLGTAGFMSPEQWMASVPTIKEDIYALGGFMIMCLTGLVPAKFEMENKKLLSERLVALNVNSTLIQMILGCVENHPEDRPSIGFLLNLLVEEMYELNSSEPEHVTRKARFRSSIVYKSLRA